MATLDQGNVQGNIIGGFMKDHQTFVMLSIENPTSAKAWIQNTACDQVATANEVLQFNNLFKLLKARRPDEEAVIRSTWLNIAFTSSGLSKLGVSVISQMDPAFAAASLKDRARAILADAGASDPDLWLEPYRDQVVDVVLIVASDSQSELATYVDDRLVPEALANGMSVKHIEHGNALPGSLRGHEHFGYKDGVSQPTIDVTTESLGAWDFVVNGQDFPPTPPTPLFGQPGYGLPVLQPTPIPPWLDQGSYLVFRRLRQDVAAFNAWIRQEAPRDMAEDRFAAKIVGRYKDGAPYQKVTGCPYDPDQGDPKQQGHVEVLSADNINNFNYDGDAFGSVMPFSAHIRKTNPRGSFGSPPKRIVRRGIAYGIPYDPDETDAKSASHKDADRGLLFVAYQASIQNQFEFIQQSWANAPAFPNVNPAPGVDPLIGSAGASPRSFTMPLPAGPHNLPGVPAFVTTSGTLYCFSPSIAALKSIGN